MTYGQFNNCLDGYSKRIEEQIRISDILNHSLGKYFRIAMSDKRYPDKPFSEKTHSSSNSFTDDAELDKMIDAQIEQQG